MLESEQYRIVKLMRLAARIIGFGAAGFFLTFLIGEGIAEFAATGWEAIEIEGVLLVVIVGIALAGCLLSWWREQLAGILLVSSAIAMGIHIGIVAQRNELLVWSMVGLPYLIAGVLFLNSWRLSRKIL